MDAVRLSTDRLDLRPWTPADRDPFALMNADPEVMRYFPAPLTRAQSDAFVDRIEAGFAARGYGWWAVEIRASAEFAGFVGLAPVPEEYPFAPATEIGWRLGRRFWNHGFATEAARAAMAFAFEAVALPDLVALTTQTNTPSRRVMEKLGMTHDPAEDFDNPRTPGWWGQRHLLYRISSARGGAGA